MARIIASLLLVVVGLVAFAFGIVLVTGWSVGGHHRYGMGSSSTTLYGIGFGAFAFGFGCFKGAQINWRDRIEKVPERLKAPATNDRYAAWNAKRNRPDG